MCYLLVHLLISPPTYLRHCCAVLQARRSPACWITFPALHCTPTHAPGRRTSTRVHHPPIPERTTSARLPSDSAILSTAWWGERPRAETAAPGVSTDIFLILTLPGNLHCTHEHHHVHLHAPMGNSLCATLTKTVCLHCPCHSSRWSLAFCTCEV